MADVVEQVRALATSATKKSHKLHGVEITPAKWAAEAGFQGSAASPLREHLARASGNGCGRNGRYPKMAAEVLLDTLALADEFKAAEGAKATTIAKRIRTKVRPAAVAGAKQAKGQQATRKRGSKTAA